MVIINVLSNTQATLEAQFMPKLSNTKADLKKKKACSYMMATFAFSDLFNYSYQYFVEKK